MSSVRPVRHFVPRLFEDGALVGGAERYALELARAMSAVTTTELVTFAPPGRSGSLSVVNGVRVRHVGRTTYFMGQVQNPISPRIFRLASEAALVHCHQRHVIMASSLALWSRAIGVPVVGTDHGGGGRDFADHFRTGSWFDAVTHVSRFSEENFGESERSSSSVVYGGVDTRRFREPTGETKRTRFLFVGRLLPHKGVLELVGALPEGSGLDIVGPSPDPTYEAVVRQAAEGRDVRLLGTVSERELPILYGNARALILPSSSARTAVPELLGQVVLEAMSCATPALVTDAGALPEVVQHMKTGIVVPEGREDALRSGMQLLEAGELARRLGKAAALDVRRRFTWDAVVQATIAAYETAGWARSTSRH